MVTSPGSVANDTGDLTDCGRIVVTVEGEAEHRIMVRDVGGDGVEVSKVIAVEDRTGDLPYLLAGVRLGRLEDPVRRSDAKRRVARIQRRVARIQQLRDFGYR